MTRGTAHAAALCLALASASCSAIYSFDEFHAGMPGGFDAGRDPPTDAARMDGGDAGTVVVDAGQDAGEMCTGTLANCGTASGCETDLASDRANCGACERACGGVEGCWAGECDRALEVVQGYRHACALLDSERVVCWGDNTHGQLGNGTRTASEHPVRSFDGAIDVAAGFNHTCVVTSVDGSIRCWGENVAGELGVAAGPDSLEATTAVSSPMGRGFTTVTAGISFTCGLAAGGEVYCWGNNDARQLRSATPATSFMPVRSSPLGPATAIDSGGRTTCAIVSGRVVCWGLNDRGQRGTMLADTIAAPVQFSGTDLTMIEHISVGVSHACAINHDGALYCWGSGDAGEIGDGSTTANNFSAILSVGSGVFAAAAGQASTCAATSSGLACWGNNREGQLTLAPDTMTHPFAVDVMGITASSSSLLAHDWSTVCHYTDRAEITCWGDDSWGQAGRLNEPLHASAPSTVLVPASATSVGGAGDHACAIVPGRFASCWGWNSGGQLGDGTSFNRSMPVDVRAPIMPAMRVDAISGGAAHSCAVGADGSNQVWCWGTNTSRGELGTGGPSTVRPTTVPGPTQPTMLDVGTSHACSVSSDGHTLQCWGANPDGRAGGTPGLDRPSAMLVSGIPPMETITGVAASNDHTCVVAASKVYCFGNNLDGRLGLPAMPAAIGIATEIDGTTAAQHVVTGDGFSCVRTMDSVACWGLNDRGQLGDGTTTLSTGPVTVALGGETPTMLAAGEAHVCAVVRRGTDAAVLCWGANDEAQCGRDPLDVRMGPVEVPDMTDVTAITAGRDFTCVLRAGGVVSCWGARAAGRLADGRVLYQPTPSATFWAP